MRFPNACKGLKKIFFAELISLIALVPYAVSLVLVQFLPEEINKNNAEILPAEVVVTILSILSLVMMTVAYVLNVIGYVTASKDNESFKKAMLLTVAGMVLTVVSGIMENANGNPILTNTFDSMENILELLITLMTISGIVTLSVTYGDLRMVESGKALFKFLFAIYLLRQSIARLLRYNLLFGDPRLLFLLKGILHHQHQNLHQSSNNQQLKWAYVKAPLEFPFS